MLLYEHEGFIEVEAKEIQRLCRSTFALPFGAPDQNKYELQATLCDYLDKDEPRCRIALYDKSLKKAVVFTLAGAGKTSLWQYGRETLLDLGYQLEDVNLKLSPAMLEVVLRDVPGVASPAEAHQQRSEHQRLLADLQATCDEAPESPQGQRAALKLSTEKRLQDRAVALRELLEELFSPEADASTETAALLAQIKDLTARLEQAESAADEVRAQKDLSEVITAAAEKRIQELEEILVDVETKSSDVLKQKRKVVALNGRVKELEAELVAARDALTDERDKQKQFVDDVKSANEQIVVLQRSLKESENLREEAFAKLGEQESEATQLERNYKEAELRIKILEKELQVAGQRVDGFDDAIKLAEELQAQLDKAEEELNGAKDLQENLKKELSAASEEQDRLQKSLTEAESLSRAAAHGEMSKLEERCATLVQNNESLQEELSQALDKNEALQKSFQDAKLLPADPSAGAAEPSELAGRCAELSKENVRLREDFDQEHSIRKRLERGAAEDDRRISDLEQALQQAEAAAAELKTGQVKSTPETPAVMAQEMEALLLRLDQEKAVRGTLERDLEEAHKVIDSLERMVRETEETRLEKNSRSAAAEKNDERVQELEQRLRALEDQLTGETLVKKTLAKELAALEKQLAEQAVSLAEGAVVKHAQAATETVVPVESETTTRSSKPLPHELRPAPKKGAFFCPDWDLQGLPCRSTAQVFKAWETVFNVQMAIEGYPSQYCMAFMVILKQGKQKRLYLLYRLKQNKHTLLCVPAKTPKDEASLQKAIKEGLDFLRKSGFEMDEMSAENIESSLASYCLEPN